MAIMLLLVCIKKLILRLVLLLIYCIERIIVEKNYDIKVYIVVLLYISFYFSIQEF